jgi:hypothetical protein
MNVPKHEFKIKKHSNNLGSVCNATMIFKNYRGDLDIIEVYEFTGFYGAINSPEIKVDFSYDYMMCKVKSEYKDSFNRIVKVKKLDNEFI